MQAADDTRQQTELRMAFLRHLPKRVDNLVRRSRRFCSDGWDINGLSLLHADLQRMAGASGRYGLLDTSRQMHELETLLGGFLERQSLPDEAANERILELAEGLAPAAPGDGGTQAPSGEPAPPMPELPAGVQRFEPAPPGYWRRWAGDAPAPEASVPLEPDAVAEAEPEAAEELAEPEPVAVARPPRQRAKPAAAVGGARIYHLTDASALSIELDQRLEALGHEVELLESSEELKEILSALAPDLVLVDAGFKHELEGIGAVLRAARERSGTGLRLLALSEEDSVPVRLAARRAGADALMIDPAGSDEVLARINELLDPEREAAYRILVVEDDRSQALFAESILRNAGMDPKVVDNAFNVLDAMERFEPDLVLMDLYMPECDGTELTALIREREEFLNTPIVFLSGESDQDKHFEALDAGGDDFLSKPIRPKYLIAAVNSRVRRARALQRRAARREPRDPSTGLYDRSHALDRINDALAREDAHDAPGGLLFVEIDGVAALRERLGLSAVEAALGEVARLLAGALPAESEAARFGDGSFACVCPDDGPDALESLARQIHAAIAAHQFVAGGQPLRLRATVGIAEFRFGFSDASAILNVAERANREARQSERGVHRFEPPKRGGQAQAAALVQLLGDAIANDGLELLFQPIVAVQGGEQAQYQTLVRLRDDAGRLHPAAEIVPLAERADLIGDLDRWVLTRALRVIDQREDEQRPVRLFVSQSPLAMAASAHADWLRTQVEARGLGNGALIIEVNGAAIGSRLEAVAAFCSALVPSGVQFCLSQVTRDLDRALLDSIPADFLKLAPRYLGAGSDQGLRDELREVIDDAHRRGMEVIAPRIEDPRAAATLWMTGIDFLQGNLVQQAGRSLDFDFSTAVL